MTTDSLLHLMTMDGLTVFENSLAFNAVDSIGVIMKLTEIKKLSDAELGKLIAKLLGWEMIESVVVDDGYVINPEGQVIRPHLLCVSLDQIADVEKSIFPSLVKYGPHGLTVAFVIKLPSWTDSGSRIRRFATLSARERAEVCVFALTNFCPKLESFDRVSGNEAVQITEAPLADEHSK